MKNVVSFLKYWLIPLGSIAISIWFAASAKKYVERSDRVLNKIDKAIKGWQCQLNKTTIEILESLPQVVDGNANIAKMQAIDGIVKTLQDRAKNQDGLSAVAYEQLMKALTQSLHALINSGGSNA
jgi:hypothetical protein